MESVSVGEYSDQWARQASHGSVLVSVDIDAGEWRRELIVPRTVALLVLGLLVIIVVVNSLFFGLSAWPSYSLLAAWPFNSLLHVGAIQPVAIVNILLHPLSFYRTLFVIWLPAISAIAIIISFIQIVHWQMRNAAVFLAVSALAIVLRVVQSVFGVEASSYGLQGGSYLSAYISIFGATILGILLLQAGIAGWLFIAASGFESRWGMGSDLAMGIANDEARRLSLERRVAPVPPGPVGVSGRVDQTASWYGTSVEVGSYEPGMILSPDVEYATFGRRLGSLLIDQLFMVLVLLPLVAGIGAAIATIMGVDPAAGAMLTVAMDSGFGIAAYMISGSSCGQTVGQQTLGVRVCRESGERLGFWRTIGRNLLSWLSTVALFLGWLAPLWSPKRQTWHDVMTNTIVIRDTTSRLAKHAVKWGLIWSLVAGLAFGVLSGVLLDSLGAAGIDIGVETINGNEYWNNSDYGVYSDYGD